MKWNNYSPIIFQLTQAEGEEREVWGGKSDEETETNQTWIR